ncbi:unnamed protein product [Lactuca virosa]|uniref:Chloroplast envelope membrane protein n=1 Tax=Lactuca virosa TaxID=75947 RepID=A0AAU9MKP7_9ASTR|nr:unnamed protein product [Lactuca virosa]
MKATNIWKSIGIANRGIDFFSSIHLEKTMEGLKNFILSYLLIAISIVPPFWVGLTKINQRLLIMEAKIKSC